MEHLYQSIRQTVRSRASAEDRADIVCQGVLKLFSATFCLVVEGGQVLASAGSIPWGSGLLLQDAGHGFVFDNEEPVNVPIFAHRLESTPLPRRFYNALVRHGVRSLALVPMYRKGKPVGYIVCGSVERGHHYPVHEQEILVDLSQLITGGTEPASAQVQVEEAPNRVDSLSKRLFDAVPWYVLELDERRKIRWLNRAFSRVLGVSRSEIPHEDVFHVFGHILEDGAKKIASQALVPIFAGEAFYSEFEIPIQTPRGRRDFLIRAESSKGRGSRRILILIREVGHYQRRFQQTRLQFERVVRHGHLIILRTDAQFLTKSVIGETQALLGVDAQQLIDHEVDLRSLFHARDLLRLAVKIRRSVNELSEIDDEVRIRNLATGEEKWVLLKAIPLLSHDGEIEGWEGFGIDITGKKSAELALSSERRRLKALYEVSKALRLVQDPALLTLKGIRALMEATSSDSGFGCFYDPQTEELEVVAADGVSAEYLERVGSVVNGRSLVRLAVETRTGLCLGNIQEDARASIDTARIENAKSTIIVPLCIEDEVLGAIVLFCRRADRYNDEDFELVMAASNQIALAAKQADIFLQEKHQADSVAVLYRLSHELSKLQTAREVAERAFPLLEGECPAKRIWLGVLNESGTHLVGQGGRGPGVRESLQSLQIELADPPALLSEALTTKRAVIVDNWRESICPGLDRIFEKLDMQLVVVIPLISLGQTVGAVVIEPAFASTSLVRRKLPLLGSMATEIATVLLARRFEIKIANADKMRMASVLASGVAHNFNNLLQAVMGQASLIEMQLPESSPLRESSQMIIEAAGRGAALVKHLLNFSSQNVGKRRVQSMNDVLVEARDLYSSVLGGNILLEIEPCEEEAQVLIDSSQFHQLMTNLLANAREAIGEKPRGLVRLEMRVLRLASGEIDPHLPPGSYVRVDIQDNGVGMDPENLGRCFEPFFSTKHIDPLTGLSLTGSGLGLSSSYSIARQHGGTIVASSLPGEGTVFSLYLPVHMDQPQPHRSPGPKILFVELGEAPSVAAQQALQSVGCEVEVVRQFPELGEEEAEKFTFVMVDAERFESNLIRELESGVGKIPLVILTAERSKWIPRVQPRENVLVVDKPMSVHALRSLLRPELMENPSARSLEAAVEREIDAQPVSRSKGSGCSEDDSAKATHSGSHHSEKV